MTTSIAEKPMGPIEASVRQRIADEGLASRRGAKLRVQREILGNMFAEMDMRPMINRLQQTPEGAVCGELAGIPLVVDFAPDEVEPKPVPTESARIDALEAKIAEQGNTLAAILAAVSKG